MVFMVIIQEHGWYCTKCKTMNKSMNSKCCENCGQRNPLYEPTWWEKILKLK